MSNATDQKPPSFFQSDLEHSPTAQTKDSVMYYVTTSYDYCINAVKNFDVKKWFEKKKNMNYGFIYIYDIYRMTKFFC